MRFRNLSRALKTVGGGLMFYGLSHSIGQALLQHLIIRTVLKGPALMAFPLRHIHPLPQDRAKVGPVLIAQTGL